MRNFYHTCKFSTLTINFSEVWTRQTVLPDDASWERLEDVFARHLCKTFWRCLEDVLARRLEDVFKTSSRRLEDVFARLLEDVLKTSWRRLEDVLKTSWRRLEDIWLRRISWSWSRRLEDVFTTYSEDVWLRQTYSSQSRRIENVLKTSSEDEDKRRLEDVFIKTNVCWEVNNKDTRTTSLTSL